MTQVVQPQGIVLYPYASHVMAFSSSPTSDSQRNLQTPGLPLQKFLETLDWLSYTHQQKSTSSSKTSAQCSTCKPITSQSTSEDIKFSLDRVQCQVTFLIGVDHFISFSPTNNTKEALSHISAVLSIEDGELRLALTSKQGQNPICLKINTERIEGTPEVSETDDHITLSLKFQSLTIVFASRRVVAQQQPGEKTTSIKSSYKNLREHIIDMQLRRYRPSEGNDSGTISLLEKSTMEAKKRLSRTNRDTSQQFTQFFGKAISFHMPDCFPYSHDSSSYARSVASQHNHIEFVNSFIEVEITHEALKEQLGKLWKVVDKRPSSEERMLTSREIKRRRIEGTNETYKSG